VPKIPYKKDIPISKSPEDVEPNKKYFKIVVVDKLEKLYIAII